MFLGHPRSFLGTCEKGLVQGKRLLHILPGELAPFQRLLSGVISGRMLGRCLGYRFSDTSKSCLCSPTHGCIGEYFPGPAHKGSEEISIFKKKGQPSSCSSTFKLCILQGCHGGAACYLRIEEKHVLPQNVRLKV